MPHPFLITASEAPLYGVAEELLAPFTVRPLEVTISTGGALGVMGFEWRFRGDTDWFPETLSSAIAPWTFRLPEEALALLTFAAATYVAGTTYVIDEAGTVTGGANITAARVDKLSTKLQATTDLALGWMGPEVVPPLSAWGTDVKQRAGQVLKYLLKSDRGMAPQGASIADAHIVEEYNDARLWFQAVGRGKVQPQGLVDASVGGAGGEFLLDVDGDDDRGW